MCIKGKCQVSSVTVPECNRKRQTQEYKMAIPPQRLQPRLWMLMNPIRLQIIILGLLLRDKEQHHAAILACLIQNTNICRRQRW